MCPLSPPEPDDGYSPRWQGRPGPKQPPWIKASYRSFENTSLSCYYSSIVIRRLIMRCVASSPLNNRTWKGHRLRFTLIFEPLDLNTSQSEISTCHQVKWIQMGCLVINWGQCAICRTQQFFCGFLPQNGRASTKRNNRLCINYVLFASLHISEVMQSMFTVHRQWLPRPSVLKTFLYLPHQPDQTTPIKPDQDAGNNLYH